MHVAVWNDRSTILKLLLKAGCDQDIQVGTKKVQNPKTCINCKDYGGSKIPITQK